MHDPLSAGRRLAIRTIAWQAGTTALLALGFLVKGAPQALAVVMGGGAVLAGAAIAARFMVGGGVRSAESVLLRWFAGMALKWVVVLAVLFCSLAVWRLPPLPLLLGILVALVAQVYGSSRR